MKGLSELMVIIVTIIVILIAAFVIVTVFRTGLTGVVDTSENVRATGHCQFRCAVLCQNEGLTTGTPKAWTSEQVKIGDESRYCSTFTSCSCGKAPKPS